MRLSILGLLVVGVAAPCLAADSDPADEVKGRFAAYLDAFNAGEADQVAKFWSSDAVCVDEGTGERTEGQAAITEGFKTFFAGAADARLTGGVSEVRLVRPDVAIAEGVVTLFVPGAEPTPSSFTAVLVKESGDWLIESSRERDLPSAATPADALEELAWLVGDWRDDTEGVDVQTTVRWSANQAFLLRSFQADYGEGESFGGTQVIGWDPRSKQYRTWTFNSDGSFGEGAVSRNGDAWLIKMTHVGSDGSVSAGTQVLTQVGADTMRVEKIGQTVDGVPVPNGDPVTVVRIAPDASAEGAGQ
ncbi:SnoaL-like domain protein [Botrimarina colliarenosi]|uniref:SnoaL-like domain protein n=1 Tax=Botrimarina colliarenosi TaxID=2528001 RepID=A0A5C6AE98_9BACT|nr:SgcJ/EcaC family oxidoreductase [Botrimarina colliarenosi]TWT97737.1 SnoaL-like domain protein [Botrimarina colliarenosi]